MKMGALQLVKIGFLVGVVFLTAPSPDKAVEGNRSNDRPTGRSN